MFFKEENQLNLPFLTQQGGILGPFAFIMGKILNGIYEFFSLFGVHNIAICIILFTFVIKMLMLPITIKQQKYSRLSSKMNPELTKINNKYKGKNTKDPDVAKKQQAELQEVYAKYGSNPMSGCLPMLITLPIMFALYRVIYKVPAYVSDIKSMYEIIANAVIAHKQDYLDIINNTLGQNYKAENVNQLIDIFGAFTTDSWNKFLSISEFANITSVNLSDAVNSVINVNSFIFGMNILDVAGYALPGILIPIISMALYFVQNKLMQTNTQAAGNADNPTAQSMKTMNTVMPIVSGVFCVFMPIGLGIYWISSSLFQILQQLFINKYLDKVDVDEMVEKNIEKSNKKKQKYGIDTGSKMAAVAKSSTKAINTTATRASVSKIDTEAAASSIKKKPGESSSYKKGNVSYSAGSIAANAHILNKNKEKGDKE